MCVHALSVQSHYLLTESQHQCLLIFLSLCLFNSCALNSHNALASRQPLVH